MKRRREFAGTGSEADAGTVEIDISGPPRAIVLCCGLRETDAGSSNRIPKKAQIKFRGHQHYRKYTRVSIGRSGGDPGCLITH